MIYNSAMECRIYSILIYFNFIYYIYCTSLVQYSSYSSASATAVSRILYNIVLLVYSYDGQKLPVYEPYHFNLYNLTYEGQCTHRIYSAIVH